MLTVEEDPAPSLMRLPVHVEDTREKKVIFISYRRDDSLSTTGRIDDHLRAIFGNAHIYRDIDSVPLGTDFRAHMVSALRECDICVAVIGPHWISERLQNPADFVRIELTHCLRRNIPVIPVLVDGADMPKPEMLPERLRPLCYRQAVRIDSGLDFTAHVQRLSHGIRRIRAQSPAERWAALSSTNVAQRGLELEAAERERTREAVILREVRKSDIDRQLRAHRARRAKGRTFSVDACVTALRPVFRLCAIVFAVLLAGFLASVLQGQKSQTLMKKWRPLPTEAQLTGMRKAQ